MQNPSKLEEILSAVDRGDAKGEYLFGLHLCETGNSFDLPRAEEYFEDSAKKGYSEARNLFKERAKNGDAKAQYFLGTLYADNEGITPSDMDAYVWFHIAAKNGNENAKKKLHSLAEKMTQKGIEEVGKEIVKMIEENPKLINQS